MRKRERGKNVDKTEERRDAGERKNENVFRDRMQRGIEML